MHILVSGSLAFDRIMSFPGRFADHILADKIHILNVCFVGNGLTERFGGTAGNIAYNLALLGEHPRILSAAGKDFDRYQERLTALGLDLSGVCRVPGELTANCHITTDQADNQITCFNPGAMGTRCGFDAAGVDPARALAIVSPGNLEDMVALPALYKGKGIPYIFDPGQNITALSGEAMAGCIDGAMALVSNDYELEMIMKATGRSLAELLGMAGSVITTLGEQGARIHAADGTVTEVPAVPVARVVDPTGAGDAFRAGLLKGLALGLALPEAARLGAVCAKWAVENLGTQEHAFTQDEFWAVYERHFGPAPAR
ncbi:carbohydrate kinase family protein [Desulfocurvus vexinensis]|uniref:carbohydrate kinase family protein n=1 Tax=Desulfocurvus vexinensis TaxID=399548 RepID=UPI00048CF5E4|nr:carbohydrate kinase family protein [Desulfocurvus vexinensis]